MANKPLKSIKFPNLSNTYTVPEVDATLTGTGKAADAKKTGDEITAIKADLSQSVDLLKSTSNEYHTGSQKFQSYYKHTLALIVGYYNNRGVLVEVESGWRTTEKLSTTAIPSLSTNPSHCQVGETST